MSGCEEVRERLIAVARRKIVSELDRRSLSEHFEVCLTCRRRFENEQVLTAGLAAMAASSSPQPPTFIKDSLLFEFRKQKKTVPIRKPLVNRIAIAASAAAMLISGMLVKSYVEIGQTKVSAIPVRRLVPVVVAARSAPETVAMKAGPAPRHRIVKRTPVGPPIESPMESATEFFEIPYSEPLRPEERADVVRIQMPRANLAVFGLPIEGGRLDSRITADVLMGEDGVARAVRFIR